MAATIERSPAKEQLRDVLGAVVDELSDAAAGRCLGALYGAVKRELDTGNPDQLHLDAA